MAIKVKSNSYYKDNKSDTTQRDKISNVRSSNRKFGNHCLELIDGSNDDFFGILKNLPKKLVNSIKKNKGDIVKVASNTNAYSNSLLQTNSSGEKFKLKGLHTNLTMEPVNQSNRSSKNIEEMNNIFNYIHNVYSSDYCVYMMTLTVPNVSLFKYPRFMNGKKNNSKSAHYSDNFPDLVRSMFRYLYRHFPSILGGVKSFETTVNQDRLIAENPYGLLHPHCHCLIVTEDKLDVKNLKNLFFDEWCKLCGKHGMDVSKQAFDLEEVYSNDDNDNSFAKAISEATKYALKPDFYKYFPEKPTNFSRDLFASLMIGSYGFRSSVKFGVVSKAYSSLNNSGDLKSPINTAMNGNPDYNLSGDSVFPDIVTKNGQMTYANGKQEHAHFKLSKVFDMTYREIIYYNRNLLEGVLLDLKQVSWINDSAYSFYSKYDGSSKEDSFDSVIELMQRLPFFNDVNSFLDMVNSVADKYIAKGNSLILKDKRAYHLWKARYKDLNKLVKAIQYYDDGEGYLNLGFHTNPNLRYKIFNWITAYKSALNLKKYDWKRAWRFYAAIHNGENQVAHVMFSDDEYQSFMAAMQSADDFFGDYDSVQPAEKACPKSPFCFVKFANGLSLRDFGKNTGEILNPSNYGQLTARIDDDVNYDQNGTKWNVNLFASFSKYEEIEKSMFQIVKPFIKRNHKKRSKNVKN